VIEEIVPISARLIANKSGFKFRTEQIERLTEGLRKEVQEA
jgi:ATP phosphoribosyltransferase/ATP phosphoribosyltransferase regulatory subunit